MYENLQTGYYSIWSEEKRFKYWKFIYYLDTERLKKTTKENEFDQTMSVHSRTAGEKEQDRKMKESKA